MKTPIEMQLKILDKMRENVEKNINMMTGIEYEVVGKWYEVRKSLSHVFSMNSMTYRVKPETITINGVEIPKPLSFDEIDNSNQANFYVPVPFGNNFQDYYKTDIRRWFKEGDLVYHHSDTAIEASKALFGITG